MSVPVRCFTCGKILACFEETYAEKLEAGISRKEALDSLGLTRDCCRNIMMTTVDHLANIMPHSVPFYDSDSDSEVPKQPVKTWRKKTEEKIETKTEDKPKKVDKKQVEDKPKKTVEDKPKKTVEDKPKKTEDKPKKVEKKETKTEDKPKKIEDKPKKVEKKESKTEDKPKKTDKLKKK